MWLCRFPPPRPSATTAGTTRNARNRIEAEAIPAPRAPRPTVPNSQHAPDVPTMGATVPVPASTARRDPTVTAITATALTEVSTAPRGLTVTAITATALTEVSTAPRGLTVTDRQTIAPESLQTAVPTVRHTSLHVRPSINRLLRFTTGPRSRVFALVRATVPVRDSAPETAPASITAIIP